MNLLFTLLFFVLIARPASAYIDPGTGSFLFQILAGIVLGGLFTIKIYFKKIKNFCSGLISGKNKKDAEKS